MSELLTNVWMAGMEAQGRSEAVEIVWRMAQDAKIPTGIEFHAETALTQARMASRKADALSMNMPSGQFNDEQGEIERHLASVIEQLTEIIAKIKSQSRLH